MKWNTDTKPVVNRLVLFREQFKIGKERKKTTIIHVGTWSGSIWNALSRITPTPNGDGLPHGFYGTLSITNITGWMALSALKEIRQ